MARAASQHRVGANRSHDVHGRGTNKQRGYDSHWRRISRLKRQQQPMCEVCGKQAAVAVDHITPFRGVSDPLRTAWSNLQSICGECHAAKTARHGGGGGKVG